jgi:hypothetical protein
MPDEPDRTEKGVRLGCGAAAGLAVGTFAAVRINPDSGFAWLAIVFAGVALFALGARYDGDEFWWKFLGERR